MAAVPPLYRWCAQRIFSVVVCSNFVLIVPLSTAFPSLSPPLAKVGKALEILHQMNDAGVRRDVFSYNVAMSG